MASWVKHRALRPPGRCCYLEQRSWRWSQEQPGSSELQCPGESTGQLLVFLGTVFKKRFHAVALDCTEDTVSGKTVAVEDLLLQRGSDTEMETWGFASLPVYMCEDET